jgi:hypothetical protein
MDKTKVLFFSRKRPTPVYRHIFCLNNRKIIYSSTVKFLGINITENLNWTTHTQHVCIKLNRTLYLIKSLRDSVSLPVLRNVYFTKFESIMKYGMIFWGGRLKDTETVFKVHKKCLRVIKGVNNQASCRSLF